MPSGRLSVLGSSLLLSGMLAASATLTGCQAPPKPAPPPPPPPPASAADVDRVQMMMQQHDHEARAGSVVRLLPDSKLAAVELDPRMGSATTPVRMDDAFTVTDSRQTPVANGRVVSMEHRVVVLKYMPLPGGRDPMVGDLAVHLSMGE